MVTEKPATQATVVGFEKSKVSVDMAGTHWNEADFCAATRLGDWGRGGMQNSEGFCKRVIPDEMEHRREYVLSEGNVY
jgi:hypothetical protein